MVDHSENNRLTIPERQSYRCLEVFFLYLRESSQTYNLSIFDCFSCLSSLPRLRECVLWEFFVEHRAQVVC